MRRQKNPPPIVTRKVDAPICPRANVRYLYQPGELEGGKRWATDPIWSVDIHKIDYHIITQGIGVYYLKAAAPKRGFVKEELLVVTRMILRIECFNCVEKIKYKNGSRKIGKA